MELGLVLAFGWDTSSLSSPQGFSMREREGLTFLKNVTRMLLLRKYVYVSIYPVHVLF